MKLPQEPTHLHTRPETAQRLRYSIRSIDAMIARGELEVVRFAGKTLIPERAIEDFIARHKHAATR